jgi:hypothetical protein
MTVVFASDIWKFSKTNWEAIPREKRTACLNHLTGWLPKDLIDEWKQQYVEGNDIGGGWFHFSVGMQIRNRLRDVLLDKDLPPVEYPNGEKYQNWDDYFLGAVIELFDLPA